MASKFVRYDNDKIVSRNPGFHEDFKSLYTLASTTLLNSTLTGSTPTAVIAASALGGGQLSLFTDTTVNNEAYAWTALNLFPGFLTNQPMVVECQMQWTEANTNKAGVIFGFASATKAGILADTTGVPISTTMSAAFLYKLKGTTNWHSLTSVGTTQVDTDLTKQNNFPGVSAAGGPPPNATSDANQHLYRVEFYPQSSTLGEARYFIDDAFMHRDVFTTTSSVAMYAIVGIKNLNGTNAETLVVTDFWGRVQKLPVTALTI
jgi:hypothetical protein